MLIAGIYYRYMLKYFRHLSLKNIRYHIAVVSVTLILISVMTITTVIVILSAAKDSARQTAEKNFNISSLSALERTETLLWPAFTLSSITSNLTEIDISINPDQILSHPVFPVFVKVLREYEDFYSVYLALGDGSFYQIINTKNSPYTKKAHDAPDNSELIIRTIIVKDNTRNQSFVFLDSDLNIIKENNSENFDFDPLERMWYKEALEYNKAVLSNPYVFNSLNQPGITVSCKIPGDKGVVGVDVTISRLIKFVSNQKISENGGIALLTDDKLEIASSDEVKDFFCAAGSPRVVKLSDTIALK